MPGLQTYLDMYTSAGGGGAPGARAPNPFQKLATMAQGSTQSPVSAGQSQPTRQGGGFNALLTPDAPGILGILGKLSGNPTREEWLFQKAGMAQQRGMEGLSKRIAEGMPPQQAVVDFVNSPEGMDFFTSVPNPAEEIKRQLGLMVAAPAEPIKVGPGETVLDGSSMQPVYNNPTTETQNFTGMAALSNLPREQIQEIAAARLKDVATGETTQTERATQSMFERGLIDADTMLKLNAGVLTFEPVTDATGKTISHVLMDKSSGQLIQPSAGATQMPVSPGDPSYAPGVRDDGYDPDENAEPGEYLKQFTQDGGSPADIVDGAGMVGSMGSKVGGLFRNFVPGFENAGLYYAKAQRALTQIKNDARSLKDSGRYIKSDLEILDSLQPSTGMDPTEDPVSAADTLISYRIWLEQRVAAASRTYQDSSATGEVRGKALLELKDLEKAMMNVPDLNALEAKKQALSEQGPAGIRGIKEGVGNIGKAIGKGVEMEQQGTTDPLPSFTSEDDLRKALLDKSVDYGDAIMFNGKKVRIRDPNAKGGGK